MSGKRFGAALSAGLLLGLVVVAAWSGVGFTFGLFGSFTASPAVLNPSTTVTEMTTTASATVASAVSSSTQSSSVPAFGATNSSVSAITQSSNTTGTQGKNILVPAAGFTSGLSSRLDSITQQPILTNAIIFLPVVVALVLGAVLYLASARSREKSP